MNSSRCTGVQLEKSPLRAETRGAAARIRSAVPPLFLTGVLALATACGAPEPEAYGNFEADEVTVSAEVDGRLLSFEAREGTRLEEGERVGLIDTVQAALQLREARSRLAAARSGTGQAEAEIGALRTELATAERDLARVERLHASDAATDRQLDEARTRVSVLRDRLRAAGSGRTGRSEEAAAIEAQIARLEDRLDRSRIRNPVPGTVLVTYVETGEFVQPGRALYRIARLDTLTFRAYVDGGLLGDIRLGQEATVTVDATEGRHSVGGTVSWIASDAEFTPTPIQTREERTDLVYAVEIRVPNPDARLKIGMPGDVQFSGGAAGDGPDGD